MTRPADLLGAMIYPLAHAQRVVMGRRWLSLIGRLSSRWARSARAVQICPETPAFEPLGTPPPS